MNLYQLSWSTRWFSGITFPIRPSSSRMTKSKSCKISGQGSTSTTSPSTITNLHAKTKVPPGQTSSATHASVGVSPLNIGPPPSHPLPLPPTGFTQDVALVSLIHSLPSDLRVFLDYDYEAKYNKITKVMFYWVLIHFDPGHRKVMSTTMGLWSRWESQNIPLGGWNILFQDSRDYILQLLSTLVALEKLLMWIMGSSK